MNFERGAGILLHPTSLAGRFPIGDIGPAAREFVALLADAGQKYWQMLPVGPTGFGDSPYQSLSAFAGNPLLISPDDIVEQGFLDESDINYEELSDPTVADHAVAGEFKQRMLGLAFDRVEQKLNDGAIDGFDDFVRRNYFWLDDYALYVSLKEANGLAAWSDWSEELKLRQPNAIDAARNDHARRILQVKFEQFVFYQQWARLRDLANRSGVKLIGDVPIFAAYDSSDVWCNQSMFRLNDDGSPRVVAGVPPDHFSKTGQLWGNPIYDWDAMQADGFRWWAAVMYRTFILFDIVRLDHFRGFLSTWEVPGGDETAENGEWVEVAGRELFATLESGLGELPIIVEDLGFITDEVEALRAEFEFPGMRVLQFGFGGDTHNRDLPHNFESKTVVYTGTHDNDTTAGWWAMLNDPANEDENLAKQAAFARQYLNCENDEPINDAMIRAAYSSVADIAIIPMQDILGTGSEGRMNTPATIGSNWKWRMTDAAFATPVIEQLRNLAETYGRI